MIITQQKKSVVKSHDFQETSCTIDAEDMRYVASLLRNNYSNSTLATIREVIANAVDANLEAKATKNVEVSLPTSINPTFCVRDYGGGLSQEEMIELYSKFGKSTKRTSNNYIGGFGIGKFAPLSYGDSFSVVSWNGGTKTTYNVFIDENEDTKILMLDESPNSVADEGLEIRVAVADEDVFNFRKECLQFFRFFRQRPTIINLGDDKVENVDKFLEGENDAWFFTEQEHRGYGYNASAIMGDVVYPINPHSMNISGEDADSIKNLLNCQNLYLRFPIGSLKLHHSRESIEYNKNTQEILVNKTREVLRDMKEIATNKLKDAEDLWEAKRLYNSIVNSMDYHLRGIFKDAFYWDGIKIDSAHFHKERLPSSDYHMEDMTIKVYTQREDSNVTDGYAVKTQKESYAYAQKGSVLALDDVESPHGGALRARTIFNSDDSIKSIYCIKFNSAKIQKQFTDNQHFDKVSDKSIIRFSKTDKAKVVRGTSNYNKGNSRANIALFEFDMESSRHYRNTDWWTDSKAKEVEDGIFVPIYNYRFVDESTKLEVMPLAKLDASLKLLKGMDVEIPKVYGVRVKDIEKAKKLGLESFSEFFQREAEQLLNRKEILQKIADYEQLDSTKDAEGWYHLEGRHSASFWNLCKKRLSQDSLMYNFLKLTHKKEKLLEEVQNFNALLSMVQRVNRKFKLDKVSPSFDYVAIRSAVYKTYPMMKHLTFNSWGEHRDDEKIGLEYVNQMDILMELEQSKSKEKVA
jgi:hypothetical protein